MHWNKTSESLPEISKQKKYYLIFSTFHKISDPMRFRIIESQFIKHATDTTHWAEIKEPK